MEGGERIKNDIGFLPKKYPAVLISSSVIMLKWKVSLLVGSIFMIFVSVGSGLVEQYFWREKFLMDCDK